MLHLKSKIRSRNQLTKKTVFLEKSGKEEIYQFCRDLNKWVSMFIKFNPGDFDQDFVTIVENLAFKKINDSDIEQINSSLNSSYKFLPKIITVKNISFNSKFRATNNTVSNGSKSQEQNFFKGNHFLYSLDGNLLVYSFNSIEWNLGIIYDNLLLKSNLDTINTVFTRSLGLALSHTGVIGLWGKIISNNGVVVASRKDSKGQGIFVSMEDGAIISATEALKIRDLLKIYRYDHFNKHNARMTFEELYGFLLARCTYLHLNGPGPIIRKNLWMLARSSIGIRTSEKQYNLNQH
ncbi:MAG: hypothetical protein HQK51_15930 [Oligoflexia bacterium]|nr:hypothetical protein [Oligoflexia bacterium]